MKFLFAPDSYKGTLTALRIAELLEEAALRCFPGAEIVKIPVADGGEGTVEALVLATGGSVRQAEVTGPLFEPVRAAYGLLGDGKTAVIEMAASSGLPLVPPGRRNPLHTTTRGVGELMRVVMEHGCRRLLIGIGGSATNDGGMGMLAALGARFLDARGNALFGCGADLENVERIDLSGLCPLLRECDITVICDVTNPLLGPTGATAVYGPQKGADESARETLERGMERYAAAFAALGYSIADFAGAGAAGGLGAALGGVLGAKLRSGIDAVLDAVDFERRLEGVDLVLTGEGRMDGQSVRYGKVPAGVASRAAARGVPTIALCGGLGDGAQDFLTLGDTSVHATITDAMPLAEALPRSEEMFRFAAERLFRTLKIGMEIGSRR